MRIIKDILRLKFEANLSRRQIACSLNIGLGAVSLHLKRDQTFSLIWPLPGMNDSDLERLLFSGQLNPIRGSFIEPDYAAMHKELKQKELIQKGVTRQLLWEEYKQAHKDNGYQYLQYCQHHCDWVRTLNFSFRLRETPWMAFQDIN